MTTPSRSIVCGTDFSENAAQACTAAAALAKQWDRPLALVHAADEFNAHAETKAGLKRFLHPFRERLDAEVRRLSAAGVAVSGEVTHGSVAEEALLDFVNGHPAELVVVSAVSKTGFDRWTLGSVSERIAEAAPAVTLIVRAAEPFEAWARGDRALRVFVAADFSASTDSALRWVGGLTKLGACEVKVAYVDSPWEERERLGLRRGPGRVDNSPEVQAVLERDLKERVAAMLGDADVKVSVRASLGRVDAQLVHLAVEAQADVLVIGTHQRSGLARLRHGSVSRGILRHAPMSVACVPAQAAPAPAPSIRPCRRVVAAADLSERGGLALSYAYSVVNDGGTVCLVHVAKRSQSGNCEERLRAMIPAGAEEHGIKTEIEVIAAEDAIRAICGAAETANADIVCVGAHARPGAAARVMGSVALGVLQQCRRPVLVVWPAQQ